MFAMFSILRFETLYVLRCRLLEPKQVGIS